MQSLFMAISDLLASLVLRRPKNETLVPVGYRSLYFHCWLCDGITEFACKSHITSRSFVIECCRCGVENLVTLQSNRDKND